jgi:uncharacterized membrane protein YhfC
MDYEILPPPENYAPANDYAQRVLSQKERRERDSYDEALDDMIEAALEQGEVSASAVLDALIASAPDYLHVELRQRYAKKLSQARKEYAISGTLNQEQRALLTRIKALEAQLDTTLISAHTLRQLRSLFLRQPQLLEMVAALGKVLAAYGVTGIAPASHQEMVSPATTPITATVTKTHSQDAAQAR